MAEEMATGTREWAGLWLSEERLVPYLEACGGDADRAVELHEWNISLAQVLMRDVAHLEVAMRNAYDRALSDAWGGGAHWLLDDGSPVRRPLMRKAARGELDLNRINRKIIDAAVEKLPAGFTTGQLVSNLTLGFWVHLADRSREAAIWRTALYRTWPRGTRRKEPLQALDGVLCVRNRVAHDERLFDPRRPELSPIGADADAVRLFRGLCPDAAARVLEDDAMTPVERFLAENPAPADVRL